MPTLQVVMRIGLVIAALVPASVARAENGTAIDEAGRWKIGSQGCYWDANDDGPDQCSPNTGRWKFNGTSCYWDATDSGPNQCNPDDPIPPQNPDPIVVQTSEGTMTFTPRELDGDPMTAEFHVVANTIYGSFSADYAVRTDTLSQTHSNVNRPPPIARWPRTCDANPVFQNETWAQHADNLARDAVRNGIITAGGAAIPCLAFTYGWLACVGGGFTGAVFTTVLYDAYYYPSWCFTK